ncbi:MAG: ATP-binding protein [Treponema sp.]|nr:ATP-binding protein [Treponema sp.]
MKTSKLLKLSAINKIILVTLAAITAVFILQILMLGRILISSGRNNAITMYEAHVIHITDLIGGNLLSINNSLDLTQQMLAMLDPNSPYADIVAGRILFGMMELKENIYNAWFVFDKGLFCQDRYFIRDFIRHDGIIVEIDSQQIESLLEEPQDAAWFWQPFTTGNRFFDDVSLYDYRLGDGQIYTSTISVPIAAEGRIVGVCGIDFIYEDMFSLIDIHREMEGWTVLLLSPDMTILHGPRRELLYQNLEDFPFRQAGGRGRNRDRDINLAQSTLEHGAAFSQMGVLSPFSGHSSLVSIHPITVDTESGRILLYLYIDAPMDTLTAQANQQRLLTSPLLLIQYLIAFFIIIRLAIKLKRITEKAEAARERAEEATEAKAMFLANMSHEIRTPMNAIIGMSELLLSQEQGSEQGSEQIRQIRDIHVSAISLLDIINDILDLSKVQAGKLELSPVHYDLNQLIDNIGSMAKFLSGNKNLDFKLHTEGGLPGCLYGDDVRLRQILLNVLGNAIKFTNEGFVHLSVSATDTSVNFDISDSGIGIAKEEIPRLFDAFTQADMRKNRSKEGTGLGLSITKSLLEMMGGQVSVESVYGQGTTFHITIPKIPGDPALIQQYGSGEITISAPGAKILVVDDNTINLNVAAGLLRLFKVEADTATSGRQAIQMLRETPFDLVFMDHMMPEMDGVEAAKIIREMGLGVPIIALTANVTAGAREEFLAAGMNDLLTKPVKRALLGKVLEDWLPAEKIVRVTGGAAGANELKTEADSAAALDTEFWRAVEQIEGLSLKSGLDMVSGQRDVFERSLRLTVREIEKSEKNLNVFLASADMRGFRIEVHGIKGSLANIGADKLSSMAKELETAADSAGQDFCAENLPPFLEGIGALRTGLSEAFAQKTQGLDDTLEISAQLPVIFEKLKTAFAATDFLAIDKGMESLAALNPQGALKEEIEKIKDAVLMMDYDAAVKVMHDLLK